MPDFIQRNPLVLVLGAAVVALLVVIGFETGWGTSLRSPPATATPLKAASVDAKLLPPLAEAAPEQVYPETGSRPLFTPTRRPAPLPEAVGSMVKGQYVLQGVTILGDTRIALLRDKNGGRIHRVEKGRDLNGVTIAEIEPDKVTLRQGGDTEVVALVVQRPGGASPAPIPSATGPFGAPAPGSAPPPAGGAPATRVPVPTPAPPPGARPPGSPLQPMPSGAPVPPGSPGAAPAAPAAAMTPEELLARRRARRAQQAQ